MRLLRQIRNSIGLMQAVSVLFASVVIGFALGAIQLRHAYSEQMADAAVLAEDILLLAEGGASNAAWTLDRRLAADIVNSVMAIEGVEQAAIIDEQNVVLASAAAAPVEASWIRQWFVPLFLTEPVSATKELYVTESGRSRLVGTLTVSLSSYHLANAFFDLTVSVVLASLVEAFLIGLLLLWLSSRLVTSPLRKIANSIAEVHPQRPEDMHISVSRIHRSDELGMLVDHTNGMLERLAASQRELRHLATRDAMTGLPNRALIRDRLRKALIRADRQQQLVAVLFVDLDRFKSVNDSYGHDAGDDLLLAVSEAITTAIRSQDSVGRLGGDEFLVVLEDLNDISEVVVAARRVSDAMTAKFAMAWHELRASASIGISVFPNDGNEAETLIRQADLAMYKAKEDSGTSWHFFAQEMSANVERRLKQEMALAKALERDELTLHFQPKFEAVSGALAGCEALLRWRYEGRLVSAGEFIHIAEESGIIMELGLWMLDEVCRQIDDWSRNLRPISVAVNISTRQLRAGNFVDQVLEIAERYGIDKGLLELEITETVLMRDLDRNYQRLSRLRAEGIAVSIDDFGTGYSSLSYLTQLPINSLKIDRCFVSGDRSSTVVLSMILAMAKALQISTVAEGVESERQRQMLINQGCNLLQGYLMGRPVAAGEFETLYLMESGCPGVSQLSNKEMDCL